MSLLFAVCTGCILFVVVVVGTTVVVGATIIVAVDVGIVGVAVAVGVAIVGVAVAVGVGIVVAAFEIFFLFLVSTITEAVVVFFADRAKWF